MVILKSFVASLAMAVVAHTAAITTDSETADILPNLIVMTRQFEGGEWSYAPEHHERIRREYAATPIEKRSRAQISLYKSRDCSGSAAATISVNFSKNYCNAAAGINCIVVSELTDAHISYCECFHCIPPFRFRHMS
jgi:hypothetical protein